MIRPFRLGDIFLVQRLAGQATKLNAAQALLFPKSPSLNALSAVIPWGDARVTTYILQQKGNQLARAGFVQVQRRPGRPEADLLLLAPALDTPSGHPAIWEKLLSHFIQEAATDLARIYCDVPDQPLPVNTLKHVGFVPYNRETIWRLTRDQPFHPLSDPGGKVLMRSLRPEDEWAVGLLYARVTPEPIQRAEGMGPESNSSTPPFLQPNRLGAGHTFVLEAVGEVAGCVQVQAGRRGVWLRICADMTNPEQQILNLLVNHALAVVRETGLRLPVYIGVGEHHGGLSAVLADYGFAPFTDRAKMVKYVVQWVRDAVPSYVPALETVTDALPSNFSLPEQPHIVQLSRTKPSVQEASLLPDQHWMPPQPRW